MNRGFDGKLLEAVGMECYYPTAYASTDSPALDPFPVEGVNVWLAMKGVEVVNGSWGIMKRHRRVHKTLFRSTRRNRSSHSQFQIWHGHFHIR